MLLKLAQPFIFNKLKNQETKKKLKEEGERLQTQLDQSVRLTRLTFDTGSVIEIKLELVVRNGLKLE